MSLLLDALKRAEQEKLARQAERAASEAASGAASDRSIPASRAASLELETIEQARAAAPAPAAAPAAAPGNRANAQAMFAAKVEAPTQASANSRMPILAGAAAIALVVLVGAAYVWFQLSAINTKPYAARATVPASPAAPALPPGPTLLPPEAPVPAPASGNPAAPPVALIRPEALSPEARKSRPPAADAEKLVADLLREAPPPSPPPLKLAKQMVAPKVNPHVSAGYAALRQGDLGQARRSYQSALEVEPDGIDALLGIATVEGRSGDRAGAARHYRRVLELDARNATALAGLAAVADLSRPDALEPALRADIARYPQSAALHMTLGNLYATQGRWNEAQAAFFEALRFEPQNADVLYNLAVALDNLNQARLAGDYYRRALAQAKSQPVQFDQAAAERRLGSLPR